MLVTLILYRIPYATVVPDYIFNTVGVCNYCYIESYCIMSISLVLVCKDCFIKVLDAVLKPKNLNKKIIEALKNVK